MKKILALVLAALMLLSTLSACKSVEAPSDTKPAETNKPPAAPETTETSSSDQSTDNSYNGNGYYNDGSNGYYSNPWDLFNNFFGSNG